MNYFIRDMVLSDFEDVAKNYYLRYEELKFNPKLGVSVKKEPPTFSEELDFFVNLYKRIIDGDVLCKVAIIDDNVVGIVSVQRLAKGYEHDHIGILGVDINEKFRNFGIGQALLKTIINDSKAKFELLTLEVSVVNEIAIHIYEKIGFSQYGLKPKALKRGNSYFDYILMYMEV
ncbi:MAG: GNAT family N-acetyltransferase [Candidatus Acididesulfobacter guangdongensis]|uniref:GNAT family N-acetyltransferase n=1 Tax=Acididesulfobacter guangdongensis TaxID=2597225 RepID=A0A519BJ21_ACIG2|nr:MAG: GNAT family N-acetyltransferase [Candidatus Acididesulfobacter guangdongensis]